jgi:hypothetical protein
MEWDVCIKLFYFLGDNHLRFWRVIASTGWRLIIPFGWHLLSVVSRKLTFWPPDSVTIVLPPRKKTRFSVVPVGTSWYHGRGIPPVKTYFDFFFFFLLFLIRFIHHGSLIFFLFCCNNVFLYYISGVCSVERVWNAHFKREPLLVVG